MSFQLHPSESLRRGCRRTARKVLREAVDQLETSTDRDEMIHDVRRRLKKVRAILRLVRFGMSRHEYQRENRKLRDLARPLNSLRDASVILASLAEIPRSPRLASTIETLSTEWQTEKLVLEKQFIEDQHLLEVTAQGLRAARRRVPGWNIELKSWKLLSSGLRDSYQAGQLAFHAALLTPQANRLHEWRKRAKHLYYQLQLLRSIAPEWIEEQLEAFDQLTERLGQHHDLTMLSSKIADQASLENEVREELLAAVRLRSHELTRDAFAEGGTLYRQNVDQMLCRIKRGWKHRSQ